MTHRVAVSGHLGDGQVHVPAGPLHRADGVPHLGPHHPGHHRGEVTPDTHGPLSTVTRELCRYYAVCMPLRAGLIWTKNKAGLVCLVSWLLSIILTSPMLAIANYQVGEKNGQCHFTSMTKLPNTTDLANYHIILGPGHGPRQPEVQHERGPALDQGLLPLDHQPLLLGAAAGPRPPLRRHRPPPHRRGPGAPRTIVSKISPVYGCTL